jgi:hypothetical protein
MVGGMAARVAFVTCCSGREIEMDNNVFGIKSRDTGYEVFFALAARALAAFF